MVVGGGEWWWCNCGRLWLWSSDRCSVSGGNGVEGGGGGSGVNEMVAVVETIKSPKLLHKCLTKN